MPPFSRFRSIFPRIPRPQSAASVGFTVAGSLPIPKHITYQPEFSDKLINHNFWMQSGKTYLHKVGSDLPLRELHDLNLPPPSSSTISYKEDSAFLDLKLAGGGISSEYQSVCTVEKVKSALERAHRRQVEGEPACASGSPSSSTTSSSVKRLGVSEEDDGSDSAGGMMAAACPSCLLYVLISKAIPRCPRCDSHVPVPFLPKKPRFDLNSC